MMEWLWNIVVNFLLGVIPLWVWIVIAGLLVGWAWKTFGWQGVAGAAIAVLTLGAYRQGWRDRGEGKAPIVPPDPIRRPERPPTVPRKRRNVWSVQDILRGRND